MGQAVEGAHTPRAWQHPWGHPLSVRAQSLKSCLTLCDTMDCSPRGSSVHGILQARILEWVAMPSSTGSSPPRDQSHISYTYCIGSSLPLVPPGNPYR